MIKKLKSKVKAWWRRNIVAPVPPGQEDMFDEYIPEKNKNWKCSICGKNTYKLDWEYYGSGFNHLACELKQKNKDKLQE